MHTHQELTGESTPYDVIVNDDGDVVVPDEFENGKPEPQFNPVDRVKVENPFKETIPLIEIDNPPQYRLAVSLADRAIALKDYMDYIGQFNRVQGSAVQVKIETSDFNKLYGDEASDVQINAKEKRGKAFDERFVRAIHTLNASKAKLNMGIDPERVRLEAIALKKHLNDEFLTPGKDQRSKRNKAVNKAQNLAKATMKTTSD
ncbi:MAG: hypothetical protein JWN75_236 [Candidatus Saccharibacteria bacterium]|nr:hypothetical protein [Candidatus Saccharibacteria bacterium]